MMEVINVHGEFANEAALNQAALPFNIRIDGEILTVTAINPAGAGTQFSVTRGANNSPASAHAAGAVVEVLYDTAPAVDQSDADTGANNLQNTPEILFAFPAYDGGGMLTGLNIIYHVPSAQGNLTYGDGLDIEFYVSDGIRQEGSLLLSSTAASATDQYVSAEALTPKTFAIDSGNLDSMVGGMTVAQLLSRSTITSSQLSILATATDADGNTSEFSQSIVIMPMPGIETTLDPSQQNPGPFTEGRLLPNEVPQLNTVDDLTRLNATGQAFIAVPGTTGDTVSLQYEFDTRGDVVSYEDNPGITLRSQNNNEFGVYAVNNATGDVGATNVSPSFSSGYAAEAFSGSNNQVVRQRSSTTLAAAIGASLPGMVEAITVTDAAALQDLSAGVETLGTGFEIVVDFEEMLVTAVAGNTVTVQRGLNGTTAAAHAIGRRVEILAGERAMTHSAGELLGFYLVNNAGSQHLITANGIDASTRSLAGNAMNDPRVQKFEDRSVAFFSFEDANPDGRLHIRTKLVRADGRPDVQPSNGVLTNEQINNGRDADGGALDNGDFTGELIVFFDDDFGTSEFDLNFTDGNDAAMVISNPFVRPVSTQLEQPGFDAVSGTLNVVLGLTESVVAVAESGGNVQVTIDGTPITEFAMTIGAAGMVAASDVRVLNVTGSAPANTIDLSGVQSAQFSQLAFTSVFAGAGSDTVIGSGVTDVVSGGTEADTLSGGAGDDVLAGNDGDDNIDGQAGNDTVAGGNGADTLVGEVIDESVDLDAVLQGLLNALDGNP